MANEPSSFFLALPVGSNREGAMPREIDNQGVMRYNYSRFGGGGPAVAPAPQTDVPTVNRGVVAGQPRSRTPVPDQKEPAQAPLPQQPSAPVAVPERKAGATPAAVAVVLKRTPAENDFLQAVVNFGKNINTMTGVFYDVPVNLRELFPGEAASIATFMGRYPHSTAAKFDREWNNVLGPTFEAPIIVAINNGLAYLKLGAKVTLPLSQHILHHSSIFAQLCAILVWKADRTRKQKISQRVEDIQAEDQSLAAILAYYQENSRKF